MKLNLHIIKKHLSTRVISGYIREGFYDFPITSVRIFHPGMRLENDHLYILSTTDLPQNVLLPDTASFLFLNEIKENRTNSYSYLQLNADINPQDLMYEINDLFSHYDQWYESLLTAFTQNEPLRTLCRISESLLPGPIYLRDANFRTLYSSKDYSDLQNDKDIYYITENDYPSYTLMTMLQNDPDFEATLQQREPIIYPGKPFNIRVLCYNLFLEDSCIGSLQIDEEEPFTDGDFSLIWLLGNVLRRKMASEHSLLVDRPRQLEEVLEKLLDHILVDEKTLWNILQELNWDINNQYFCMRIEPEGLYQTTNTLPAFARRMSSLTPDNIYVIHQNAIVMVFNLTQMKTNSSIVYHNMIPYLQEGSFKAGISTDYRDFKDLFYYHEQCRIALNLGQKKNPEFWYFRFSDYALDYMLLQINRRLPPRTLCSDSLIQLLEYDKNNQTDYAHTLRVYLENHMKANVCAKKLFIHRNTLANRLERIWKFLGKDLDNPETCLQILLTLKLLEQENDKVTRNRII